MQGEKTEVKTIREKHIRMTKKTQNKNKFCLSLRYEIKNMKEEIIPRLQGENFPKMKKSLNLQI